ncbi:MAG TPA: DUF481 domain-containing protein [Bryobacteraceae bacterium]|nr:DUF481 domain-containing protein [Bryobacteraceae bacterium]
MMRLRNFSFCAFPFLIALAATAAGAPDVLTLVDGEKLQGKLVRSVGGTVTFHSDAAGNVSIPWSKIKELSSERRFAVIPKGLHLKGKQTDGEIPRGVLAASDQKIQLTPGAGQPVQTIAVNDAGFVIDEPAYQAALKNPGFDEDWKGALTGGISLVKATQSAQTFTGVAHLSRAIPAEDWLAARNRTLADFTVSYGKLTQPNTPQVKTNIVHFDLERDEYFEHRIYALGQAALDHNFSQGLYLQQTYGAGAGWTAIRSDPQTLDLKATASFIDQRFNGSPSERLIGSVLGEVYHRNLPAAIKFDEWLTYTPAWNNTRAYFANGSAGVTLPVYKGVGLNVSVLDSYLNDPPPGFKKNSLTFVTGVTYALP